MRLHKVSDMYHPWRLFRNLTHVKLRWAPLPPGIKGVTDFDTNEVVMDPDQHANSADRRSTISHEMQHLVRGPVMPHLIGREEVQVEKIAARLLMPDIKEIGKVLEWSGTNLEEAAEELWVDVAMLRCRLDHLHPAERGYLKRRLADD